MDIWMRDPFKRAEAIDLKDESPLKAALKSILTTLGMLDYAPLLATPEERECRVIDAKKDGTCKACGRTVWLSPSSKVRLAEADIKLVVICLICLEQAHDKLSEEAGKEEWPSSARKTSQTAGT